MYVPLGCLQICLRRPLASTRAPCSSSSPLALGLYKHLFVYVKVSASSCTPSSTSALSFPHSRHAAVDARPKCRNQHCFFILAAFLSILLSIQCYSCGLMRRAEATVLTPPHGFASVPLPLDRIQGCGSNSADANHCLAASHRQGKRDLGGSTSADASHAFPASNHLQQTPRYLGHISRTGYGYHRLRLGLKSLAPWLPDASFEITRGAGRRHAS